MGADSWKLGPGVRGRCGIATISLMKKLALSDVFVFFDTNLYRTLRPGHITGLRNTELEAGITPLACYYVLQELYSHLATPDEALEFDVCLKALKNLHEHCHREVTQVMSSVPDSMYEQLTGQPARNRQRQNYVNVGNTCAHDPVEEWPESPSLFLKELRTHSDEQKENYRAITNRKIGEIDKELYLRLLMNPEASLRTQSKAMQEFFMNKTPPVIADRSPEEIAQIAEIIAQVKEKGSHHRGLRLYIAERLVQEALNSHNYPYGPELLQTSSHALLNAYSIAIEFEIQLRTTALVNRRNKPNDVIDSMMVYSLYSTKPTPNAITLFVTGERRMVKTLESLGCNTVIQFDDYVTQLGLPHLTEARRLVESQNRKAKFERRRLEAESKHSDGNNTTN